ncbi:MAG: hypothetical protein GY757_05950, partial [bacterium]|nr:hypothetical protein [bacterium]
MRKPTLITLLLLLLPLLSHTIQNPVSNHPCYPCLSSSALSVVSSFNIQYPESSIKGQSAVANWQLAKNQIPNNQYQITNNKYPASSSRHAVYRWHSKRPFVELFIAVLLSTAGFCAMLFFFFLLKKKDWALLSFGLFTFLYGLRLFSYNDISRELYYDPLVQAYIATFITYLLPIPMLLLMRQFIGPGWKNSVSLNLYLHGFYSCTAVIVDSILQAPGTAMVPYNNILVILDMVVFFINLVVFKNDKIPYSRALQVSLIAIVIVVVNENLVGADMVPWNFSCENEALFLYFVVLGYIVAKRIIIKQDQLREQLMQADKMIALGTLVSGVAHEINNPNNFIQLNSEILAHVWTDIEPLLEKHAKTDDDFALAGVPYPDAKENIPKFIRDIQQGSVRIKNILQNLKDYARPAAPGLTEYVNLDKSVQSAVNLLDNRLKKLTSNFSVHL